MVRHVLMYQPEKPRRTLDPALLRCVEIFGARCAWRHSERMSVTSQLSHGGRVVRSPSSRSAARRTD